jgi:quercetin dioxygenase-like cupin family protein
MKKNKVLAVVPLLAGVLALCPTTGSAQAKEPGEVKVTPLFGNPLGDIPGREGVMLTVDIPPGGGSPPHRHNSHVYVYVLEGSVAMKVKGKPQVTLNPGQTFYESPKDIHEVSKNASDTKPAKFVVFMLKKKGVPPVLPAK